MTTLMICTLVLISCIKGKEVKNLLTKLKNVNWHNEINALIKKLYPWALKAGRRSARPILQFYYVLADEKITKFLEKQGGNIIKTIVVKNKLVNLIVK